MLSKIAVVMSSIYSGICTMANVTQRELWDDLRALRTFVHRNSTNPQLSLWSQCFADIMRKPKPELYSYFALYFKLSNTKTNP